MSQPSDPGITQPLGTTSARLVAVKLKSANKNIFRALLNLASANLLVRVAGMLNLVVVAALFGQTKEMDAYNIASVFPLLLAQLFAGSIEASVIPVYTQLHTKGQREKASRLFSTLLNILILGGILLTVIMFLLRQQLVALSGPGIRDNTLAVDLAPFIFPIVIFMLMNSFMECLLNSMGQFGWPAYAGMLVPITSAVTVALFGRNDGIKMLCIGMVAGNILQLLVILIRAYRAKLKYSPVLDIKSPEVRAIGKAAWPVLFGALISQASPLVDTIFSSFIPQEGSVTVINNAQKLTSVPVGVIFSSVGRAALPYLATQAAVKDMKAFKDTLRLYLWAVGIATLVLTAGMIILSRPMVQILFQRGAFTPADTTRTAITLVGLVIGLVPMSIGFIVARAFSALGKTRVLLYTTIFSVIANAVFDAIFAHFWQSFGIAFATSLVYTCTMFILLIGLRASIGKLKLFTPPREVLQVVWKLGLGQFYIHWITWKEENSVSMLIPREMRKNIFRGVLFCVGVGAIVFGILNNDQLTVRIALGSTLILAFFRYHYFLLLSWALVNAFIGSSLPFFNGNNLLSGLTIPTIILMFYVSTRLAFKRMVALPFLLLFVLWHLTSVIYPTVTSGQFIITWTTLLAYVAVAVVTVLTITTRERMIHLIDAILIPALFIVLYGIWGYFTKHNGVIDTSTGFFRISSIFGNTPPTLDLYLSVMLPLAIYRAITAKGLVRFAYLMLIIIFIVGIGLTFGRGPLVAIPVALVAMIILMPRGKVRTGMFVGTLVVGAVGAFVAVVSNTPILTRFLNSDLGSLNGRTYLWQAILNHFDPTQLLGNGLKASDLLLTNLRVGFGGGVIATAAHNIFLETLYDHGLIGVSLLIITLFVLGLSLLMKLRNASFDHRLVIATAFSIFLSIVIQSYESNDIWNQSVGIYFMIAMALPFALCWDRRPQLTGQPLKQGGEMFEEEEDSTETTTQKQPALV